MTDEDRLYIAAVAEAEELAAMTQAEVGIVMEPMIVNDAIEEVLPYLVALAQWREAGRIGPPPAPNAMARPMKSSPLRGDWDWVNHFPGHAYDEWCRHCEPEGPSPIKYPFGRPETLAGRP
jgi:hypothetical protein